MTKQAQSLHGALTAYTVLFGKIASLQSFNGMLLQLATESLGPETLHDIRRRGFLSVQCSGPGRPSGCIHVNILIESGASPLDVDAYRRGRPLLHPRCDSDGGCVAAIQEP